VLRLGDVLGVGSVQRLHHLDAKACTVIEEHGELGWGGTCSWVGAPLEGRYPASKVNDGACPDKPVYLSHGLSRWV